MVRLYNRYMSFKVDTIVVLIPWKVAVLTNGHCL